MAPKTKPSKPDEKEKQYVGFYLTLRPQQAFLDSLIYQFYAKLLDQLKLFGTAQVFINSDYNTEVLTKDKFRPKFTESINPYVRDPPLEFIMFPGDYMQTFKDGYLMFRILQEALKANGKTSEAIQEKYESYKSTKGDKDAYLRACYWFICTNFVHKWPLHFQVAFFVDCLLYGEWQVSHPNLIGLHLLALAWMMGVSIFDQFIPAGMRNCLVIKKPPLPFLKAAHDIRVNFDPPWPTTRQPSPKKLSKQQPVKQKQRS